MISNVVSNEELVDIPFSFMVNLRRYMSDFTTFYGNAVIDIPCILTCEKTLNAKRDAWRLASSLSQKMREIVTSGEPLRVLREELPVIDFDNMADLGPREVLALSHVGQVDGMLDSIPSFELEDFRGNVNTNADYGPIFYLVTHIFKDELNFCLAYNTGITSDKTAQDMADNIKTIISDMI